MRRSAVHLTAGVAGAILLASCGAAGHTAPSGTSKAQKTAASTPITPAVPAAAVTAVKTAVPFTQQQLIVVARKVYQPYPGLSFGTCDYGPPPQSIPAPAGRSHYANCPFTASLNTRYVSEAPAGISLPDGTGFLCACRFNSLTYTYSASTSASGGVVIATADSGNRLRLTIVDVAGIPKVDQIEVFICQRWYVLGSQPLSCSGRG